MKKRTPQQQGRYVRSKASKPVTPNEYVDDGEGTLEVTISQSQVMLLSKEDESLLSKYRFYASKNPNGYYAKTTINGQKRYAHILVLGGIAGKVIDHKNGNGLDNRRVNLRHVTHHQNTLNRTKWFSSSGYPNVSEHVDGGFYGRVSYLGKTICTPIKETATEASIDIDMVKRDLYKEKGELWLIEK